MSEQPNSTDTPSRKQITAAIISDLKSLGLEILSTPRHLPWGCQIQVSLPQWERKNQTSYTAFINIYSGKKGITINLQGKDTEKLKKLIQPIIVKFGSLYTFTNRNSTKIPGPETIKLIYPIIGADESGKGDYFGPLVVAAFLSDSARADRLLVELGVRDSKKISDNRCIEISERIKKMFHISQNADRRFSLMTINPDEYNKLYILEKKHGGNLNTLLKRLHLKNIANLIKRYPSFNEISVIIDDFLGGGNTIKQISRPGSLFMAFESHNILNNNNIKIQFVQKAEDKYPAVAAASIMARAEYLKNLSRLSAIWLPPSHNRSTIELKPGSGSRTVSIKQEITSRFGPEVLPHIAKTSFKIS